MRHFDPAADLKNQILLLENRRVIQLNVLQEQFRNSVENLKPSNIIKSVLHETDHNPGLMDKALNLSIGLVAGYVAKKISIGETKNMLKKIFGTFIQVAVTNIVSKNSEVIKSAGRNWVKRNLSKYDHN